MDSCRPSNSLIPNISCSTDTFTPPSFLMVENSTLAVQSYTAFINLQWHTWGFKKTKMFILLFFWLKICFKKPLVTAVQSVIKMSFISMRSGRQCRTRHLTAYGCASVQMYIRGKMHPSPQLRDLTSIDQGYRDLTSFYLANHTNNILTKHPQKPVLYQWKGRTRAVLRELAQLACV